MLNEPTDLKIRGYTEKQLNQIVHDPFVLKAAVSLGIDGTLSGVNATQCEINQCPFLHNGECLAVPISIHLSEELVELTMSEGCNHKQGLIKALMTGLQGCLGLLPDICAKGFPRVNPKIFSDVVLR